MSPSAASVDQVRMLMQAVTYAAESGPQLSQRREALLLALAEQSSADAGHWAWGRGNPDRRSLAVVGHIPFGFTPDDLQRLIEFGMGDVHRREFQDPQWELRRPDGIVAVRRSDIVPDVQWTIGHPVRHAFAQVGCENWLNVVRYSADDTWSQLLLLRRIDREEFSRSDLELVDLAQTTVPWLWATTEETVPPETIAELTPRQRSVMLLLLSGLSRKMIARRLEISENTVHDHVEAVFRHFHVGSAMELAAVFLKSR